MSSCNDFKSQLICIICLAFCNIWRKLFSITRIPRAKMFMAVETKLRSAMLCWSWRSLCPSLHLSSVFLQFFGHRADSHRVVQCSAAKSNDMIRWSCLGHRSDAQVRQNMITPMCALESAQQMASFGDRPDHRQRPGSIDNICVIHRTESTCRCRQLYYNLQFWKPALTSYKKSLFDITPELRGS